MNEPTKNTQTPGTPRWVSKALMVFLFMWIGAFALTAYWQSKKLNEGAQTFVSPFRDWDGTWEGEFLVFNAAGEEINRLRVRQEYHHEPAEENFMQLGAFEVTDPATGETKKENAINTAEFDGTDLRCKVIKDGGHVIELHQGSIEDGKLVWRRQTTEVDEAFYEWIDGDTYYIDGEGKYGDLATAELLKFEGRYRRVE